MAEESNQVFTTAFDLITHIERQREFSERTFGPGLRTEGVSDHIRKELLEIAAAPRDLSEWVDVILLALDGAWRAGYTPIEICEGIGRKQRKNEMRKWPDWRTAPLGKAIEHDRAAHETSSGTNTFDCTVQCRCGWVGLMSALVKVPFHDDYCLCPQCAARFVKAEFYNATHTKAG